MNFPKKIETKRLVLEWPENPTFELAKEIYDVVEKSRDHLAQFLPWARTMNSAEEEFIYLKNYAESRFVEGTGFCYLIYKKEYPIDLLKTFSGNEKAGQPRFVQLPRREVYLYSIRLSGDRYQTG